MCTDCRAAKRFAVTVSAWPADCEGPLNSGAAWSTSRMFAWVSFVRVGASTTLCLTRVCPNIRYGLQSVGGSCSLRCIICFLKPDWELFRVRPSEFCLTFCFWCLYTRTGLSATNCCAWCWCYICPVADQLYIALWIIFHRVSILPHFEHLLWACLTDTLIERAYV